MPIGSAKAGGVNVSSGPLVFPASVKGTWTIANDDAETAQSATDLLVPAGIDDSTFHWVEVHPGATRVLVRARMAVGATVTTDPIVRIIGAFADPASDGSYANDGSVMFLRLDNADWNATGVTLDLTSSGSTMNSDSVYAYSDVTTLDGYDVKGSWYIGVAVETAANVNSGTVPVQVLFLN